MVLLVINMVPEARSSQGGEKQFDFNSQVGVLAILQSIRQSELTPSVKNELRDLVFLYANGGGDAALRNMLEERLKANGVTAQALAAPAAQPQGVNETNQNGFASRRRAPVFAAVKPAVRAPAPAVSASPSRPDPLTPPAPRAAAVSSRPRIMPNIPSQLIDNDAAAPRSDVPPLSAPAADAALAKTPVPEPAPPSIPRESDQLPVTADKYLDRIREIKADINARVGNPVNLVDIDNAIGNEYMRALLDAMKQLNGGAPAAVENAMRRLEIVYEQVKLVVESNDKKSAPPPVPDKPVMPDPLAAPAPVPPPSETPQPVAETKGTIPALEPVPVPVIERPVPPAGAVADRLPDPKQERPAALELQNGLAAETIPAINAWQAPPPDPERIEIRPPVDGQPVRIVPKAADAEMPPSQESSVPITSSRFNIGTPVSKAPPLRRIEELPTAAALETAGESKDPLYTKEIDDGLEQLLSMWPLFSKSGLFGTGPKGREHPLFKKVSSLPIPLLLSGRFEGSTQEIKQSITDYMNGWRYEQGIVYEKGETFEQYLRRVIRHIIDWQNNQRQS